MIKYLLLLLLFCIPTVTAAPIEITATSPINEGSAAIFSIQEIIELSKEVSITDIEIQDNNSKKITTQLTLKKFNESYFLATNLPTGIQEKINVIIKDMRYTENNVLKEINLSKEFQFQETNKIHITPLRVDIEVHGYENPKITLQITNNNQNTTVIKVQSLFNNETIELETRQTKELQIITNISTSTEKEIKFNVKIDDKEIPIFITRTEVREIEEEIPTVEEPEVEGPAIKFIDEAQELNRIIARDQVLEGPLQIQNVRTERISGLTTALTNNLGEIVTARLESTTLNAQEITTVNLIINQRKNINKRYDGELQIKEGNTILATFPIRILLKEEPINETFPQESEEIIVPENKEESSWIKIIPVLIILGIIAIAAIHFYKKNKNQPDQFQARIQKR